MGAKILLVDDDEDLREACRTVLESAGYTVSTASSGKEGLAAARRDLPDLAVLDVMMESAGAGVNLAQKLRAEPKLAGMKLLMVTSVGQVTGLDIGASAGDNDYLPVDRFLEKPVDPVRLISEVKSLLGR